MKAVVDNDIVFKCAGYGLFDLLLDSIATPEMIGTLGSTFFVVSKKLRKVPLMDASGEALERLRQFLSRSKTVEPDSDELRLAARFELAAHKEGVDLDSGESILCAVVLTRSIEALITGDKRAIQALELLLSLESDLMELRGKVTCLEQLILHAVESGHSELLREVVCSKPTLDKALSICFSCSTGLGDKDTLTAGLRSYINAMRNRAPQVLA